MEEVRVADCVIVAGGWSVRPEHIAFLNGYCGSNIVCVNDAALHIQRPDCAVTMDRKWLMNRWENLHVRGVFIYHRGGAGAVPDRVRHHAFVNNNRAGPMSGCRNPLTLDGNNSGACALNLAYHRGYERVFLLGFDMQKGPNGENHFYPDYEWNVNSTKPGALKGWAGSFSEAAEQFRKRGMAVYNVNNRSLIGAFPIIEFDTFRRMVA